MKINKWTKYLVYIILFVTPLIVIINSFRTVQNIDTAISFDKFSKIVEGELEKKQNKYGIKGFYAGMIEGDKIWSKGFGLSNNDGIPITANTVFNVGSVSKALTVFGVLKLLQENKISLDDSVVKYLKQWKIPESEFDEGSITFRQLLEHTAGLNIYGFDGIESSGPLPTVIELLDGKTESCGSLQLVKSPGASRMYSGGGYTLLQILIEDISGLSFSDYMKTEVFNELNMYSSGYVANELANVSKEFNYEGDEIPSNRYIALSAAGLYTSGKDLSAFLSYLVNKKNDTIFGAIAKEAFKPIAQNPNFGMSFTIESVNGTKVVGHGGNNMGWNAQIYLAPEANKAIYFMGNSSAAAQLEIDMACVWKSRVSNQKIENSCSDSFTLIKNLNITNIIVSLIMSLLLMGAILKIIKWNTKKEAKNKMVTKISFSVLAVISFLFFLIVAIFLFSDVLLTREGISILDEFPLHELTFLFPMLLIGFLCAAFLSVCKVVNK